MSVFLLDYERAGSVIYTITGLNQMWNTGRFLEHSTDGRSYLYEVEKFIHRMYKYNWECYKLKYKDNNNTLPDILPKHGEKFNIYQLIKTLQCLLYNIEYEYFENRKEVKQDCENLKILIDEIVYKVVCETKEYENAKWG